MIPPRTSILPLGLCLALTVSVSAADITGPTPGSSYYLLADFSVQTATESDFRAEYWGRSVGNATDSCPDCKVRLTSAKDASGDFARLVYSLPKTGKGTYFAKTGLVLPLDNIWSSSNDMRQSTRLLFKARTGSSSEDGVNLMVGVESPAFPFRSAGYTRRKAVVATREWAWYSIAWRDFGYTSWMKTDAAAATKNVVLFGDFPDDTAVQRRATLNSRAVAGKLLSIDSASSPDYEDDSINALKSVQALRFEIDPIYANGGAELDSAYAAASQDATLDIDSITFVGINGGEEYLYSGGLHCTGTPLVLEDFNLSDPVKVEGGAARNYAGGFWYAVSDTDTKAMAPRDSAVGRSWIAPLNPGDPKSAWGIDPTVERPMAEMEVVLDKGNAKAHPYAGWAELGATVGRTAKMPKGVDLADVRAFEFQILAGGSDPFRIRFDKSRLAGVEFKVGVEGLPDGESYAMKIPYGAVGSGANAGDLVSYCVDRPWLQRPNGLKANPENLASSNPITRIAWKLAIVDPKEIKADTSLLQIRGVRMYGDCLLAGGCESAITRTGASRQILATYRDGLQLSYSLPGAAQIEVLRLDGSLVASHAGAATVQNLSIPVKLTRGTYLVVVRGGGQVRSATLPVVGR